MLVYRIALEKYAYALVASGRAARWNYDGRFVLYTAQSRALACLENVVHRSGEGLNQRFRTMVIEIPDTVLIAEVDTNRLPPDWQDVTQYPACRAYGEAWIRSGTSAVLRTPSAIIPNEHNFIINIQHPDFAQIRLVATESFVFDPRIKLDEV